MKTFVGVDCGATNLRVGIVDEDGKLLKSSILPSPLKIQPEKFAEIVLNNLGDLASQEDVWRGWGIGTPGPLDIKRGLILPSSNLGNTRPIDLRSQFDHLGISKVYFDRDTNLALLGESWQGVAVGVDHAVMLTLGSGVGGAVMINGQIDRGESGKAGELGHMIIARPDTLGVLSASSPIRPPHYVAGAQWGTPLAATPRNTVNVPACGLGHEGCLEALINSAKDLDELGTYLGYGLANIVDIFNPEMVIIGGGKIKSGDFLGRAREVMIEVGMKPAVEEVKLVNANLGDLSGVFGGVRLAMLEENL